MQLAIAQLNQVLGDLPANARRILDAAALHIVRLAAPYAPFPADIAKDTDIISITRTWICTRSDQFVAE